MTITHENIEGFAYIDISNPMAAWNVVRGAIFSPSCLPKIDERRGSISFAMAGLLGSSDAKRIKCEFRLENFRATRFPNTVSRLTGIFIFDDVDSVARTWEEDPWGEHFHDDYLTDVGVSADRSVRVDAQWISKMMSAEHQLVQGWQEMAERYWSGEPANETPIFERIVEGWVAIWGLDLKRRAQQEIRDFWPNSLQLLSYCVNASSIGSCDGAIIPYVTRNGNCVDVKYYLRLVDAKNPEFCEQLRKFLTSRDPKICRYNAGDDFVLPDFSTYNFRRKLENGNLIWPKSKSDS